MKKLLSALALLIVSPAFAADLPTKAKAQAASPLQPIPTNGCGYYVGINTMGGAGAVSGSPVPGASIVQGEGGVTIGYTCANAANNTVWFVEGNFDAVGMNGSTNGLSLSGPVDLFQRVAYGTPLQSFLSIFPGLNSLSTPSLPVLPPGVTAGPGVPYLYAGVHEQDISAQYLIAQNREWLIAPEIGVGMLYRLSNAVVADVFAGYEMRTNGVCLGPVGGCPGIGNMWRAGLAFKY